MWHISHLLNSKSPAGDLSQRDLDNGQEASCRIARAHKACDRCRLKKIKCNGEKPCVRCARDKVGCTLSMRRPNDPKESLRDYIASLESRQSRLIHALQRMCTNVGRPIEEKDMKDIMEVLKACGYAAEDAQSVEFDRDTLQRSNPRKRVRSKDLGDRPNREISCKVTKTCNALDVGSNPLSPEIGASSQTDETGTQEQEGSALYSDDYWNLDAYWNQVTYSQLLKETVDQSQNSTISSSLRYPLQDEVLTQDWPFDIEWDIADIAGTIDQDVNFGPLDLNLSATPARNSLMDDWTDSRPM